MKPALYVLTGAARSGKSTAAEKLAARLAADRGCGVSYVATAQAWDDEMRARIAAHRARRPAGWETLEAPFEAAAAVRAARHPVVLLDCATLLISNHLLRGGEAEAEAEIAALLAAGRERGAALVVVTNEVGWSVVPDNALARRFRDLQGTVNKRLVDAADRAWLLVAGRPLLIQPVPPDQEIAP